MNKPYYTDGQIALHLGDCRDVLSTLADASVDAIVCDPPYEINFLNRGWDASGIAYDVNMWRQCLRVLKPGGHLLAFGATRTYHRLVCAIEDAGFEIRDSIHWIYGNGMPKGQNIAKAIDRRREDRAETLKVTAWLAASRDTAGWTNRRLNDAFGFTDKASHWTTQGVAAAVPTPHQWAQLKKLLAFDDAEILPLVRLLNGRKGDTGAAWSQRPEADYANRPGMAEAWTDGRSWNGSTARGGDAIRDDAKPWQGWNTTLKPAHEPIVLARKSTGFHTVTANVLQHGTGALNIDGCRIEVNDQDYARNAAGDRGHANSHGRQSDFRQGAGTANDQGRWPANVVFSHDQDCGDRCVDDCPVTELDASTGVRSSGANPTRRSSDKFRDVYGDFAGEAKCVPARGADSGSASRFFPAFRYQAKAPDGERPRLARIPKLRLRADVTEEQRAYVLAELTKAGVDVS